MIADDDGSDDLGGEKGETGGEGSFADDGSDDLGGEKGETGGEGSFADDAGDDEDGGQYVWKAGKGSVGEGAEEEEALPAEENLWGGLTSQEERVQEGVDNLTEYDHAAQTAFLSCIADKSCEPTTSECVLSADAKGVKVVACECKDSFVTDPTSPFRCMLGNFHTNAAPGATDVIAERVYTEGGYWSTVGVPIGSAVVVKEAEPVTQKEKESGYSRMAQAGVWMCGLVGVGVGVGALYVAGLFVQTRRQDSRFPEVELAITPTAFSVADAL
jgi:hypothetical protein